MRVLVHVSVHVYVCVCVREFVYVYVYVYVYRYVDMLNIISRSSHPPPHSRMSLCGYQALDDRRENETFIHLQMMNAR